MLFSVEYCIIKSPSISQSEGHRFLQRGLNTIRGPRSSSFWVPRNLSHHIDRQARTRDTVLVTAVVAGGRRGNDDRKHNTLAPLVFVFNEFDHRTFEIGLDPRT
jgi:hypothetical protein